MKWRNDVAIYRIVSDVTAWPAGGEDQEKSSPVFDD